jgi:hypothetical protein
MTREQFLALAGQLYDAQFGSGSGSGKAPRFDTAIPAGAGRVVFASECSLKELQYQLGRAQKPPSDPKYKDSNDRRAKALGYFISYRQANPTEQWRGERNRVTVLAAVPSDKPQSYDRDAPPVEAPPSAPLDDDDIPF